MCSFSYFQFGSLVYILPPFKFKSFWDRTFYSFGAFIFKIVNKVWNYNLDGVLRTSLYFYLYEMAEDSKGKLHLTNRYHGEEVGFHWLLHNI